MEFSNLAIGERFHQANDTGKTNVFEKIEGQPAQTPWTGEWNALNVTEPGPAYRVSFRDNDKVVRCEEI